MIAGVVENESIHYPDCGSPQGGVISPLIANIFLHYVLDEWFVKEVQPRLKGDSFIVRFADDCVPRRRIEGRSPSCSYAA